MGIENPEVDWSTLKVTDLRVNKTTGHAVLVAVDSTDAPTRRVEVALPVGSVTSDRSV